MQGKVKKSSSTHSTRSSKSTTEMQLQKNQSEEQKNGKLDGQKQTILNEELIQEEEEHKQDQILKQVRIKKMKNKFVGLKNQINMCYLNSAMQVIFSLPHLCNDIIAYFEKLDSSMLNQTSASFIKFLKEKKEINEGTLDKHTMNLSELRQSFNHDLQARHRDANDTFGLKQNDSSEFYILLFEFLIKWRKDQDLKRKNQLFGINNDNENLAWIVEKKITKNQFEIGSKYKECMEYFAKETANEQAEFMNQIEVLKRNLAGLQNPVEEFFFNGYTLGIVGPCMECKYFSLSIHDFSFFELSFKSSYYSMYNDYSLDDMIKEYFHTEDVRARCKNPACSKYPQNIVKNKSARTLYHPQKKKQFLIQTPKMLKMLFKKYSTDEFGKGYRLNHKVELPILLKKQSINMHFYKEGSINFYDKNHDYLLTKLADKYNDYNYYLFSFSIQSGSLDSGHYVTRTLQYYEDDQKKLHFYYVTLNDENVSQPVYGGDEQSNITCEAYWAMYVREDQSDFAEQIKVNTPPPKDLVMKTFTNPKYQNGFF